jgi:hypothetical protein
VVAGAKIESNHLESKTRLGASSRMITLILNFLKIVGPFAAIAFILKFYDDFLDSSPYWRRKDLIARFIGAVALFCVSGEIAYDVYSSPKDWGETSDIRFLGFVSFAGAIWLVILTAKEWKERKKLEAHWEKVMSNKNQVQDIQKNPQAYRDDFKRWIERNRPLLATWKNPPNLQN